MFAPFIRSVSPLSELYLLNCSVPGASQQFGMALRRNSGDLDTIFSHRCWYSVPGAVLLQPTPTLAQALCFRSDGRAWPCAAPLTLRREIDLERRACPAGCRRRKPARRRILNDCGQLGSEPELPPLPIGEGEVVCISRGVQGMRQGHIRQVSGATPPHPSFRGFRGCSQGKGRGPDGRIAPSTSPFKQRSHDRARQNTATWCAVGLRAQDALLKGHWVLGTYPRILCSSLPG